MAFCWPSWPTGKPDGGYLLEKVRIGRWLLEIDRAWTREFYRKHRLITEDCSCIYCRNYVIACKTFAKEVLDFFDSLGIIPDREAEVYECNENEDGTHFYGGFYHIVGQVLEGKDCGEQVDADSSSNLNDNDLIEIEGFNFEFTDRREMVPKDFPELIIQIEFYADILWVLNEKP
jgi:hypothetical protein